MKILEVSKQCCNGLYWVNLNKVGLRNSRLGSILYNHQNGSREKHTDSFFFMAECALWPYTVQTPCYYQQLAWWSNLLYPLTPVACTVGPGMLGRPTNPPPIPPPACVDITALGCFNWDTVHVLVFIGLATSNLNLWIPVFFLPPVHVFYIMIHWLTRYPIHTRDK